jgi:hypothetical protein
MSKSAVERRPWASIDRRDLDRDRRGPAMRAGPDQKFTQKLETTEATAQPEV